MKSVTALSFLAFVCLCVISASADPSSPPSSAPPRLFNNDPLKACPLTLGLTDGCDITIGKGVSATNPDNILIGTFGPNPQVTVGSDSADVSVNGNRTGIKGTTLTLGTDIKTLVWAKGSTLYLGTTDGTNPTASKVDIFSSADINVDASNDVNVDASNDFNVDASNDVNIDASNDASIDATGITLTASDSDLTLTTIDSGNAYLSTDANTVYIGQYPTSSDTVVISPSNIVLISPSNSVDIESSQITVHGTSFVNIDSPGVTILGTAFRVLSTTSTFDSSTTTVNSGTINIGSTGSSSSTSVVGSSLDVTTDSINLGTSTTTSVTIGSTSAVTTFQLAVKSGNYIEINGPVASTGPALVTVTASTGCNTTSASLAAGSTDNAGSVTLSIDQTLDHTTCTVEVTLVGTTTSYTPVVVVSPYDSVVAGSPPYISAVTSSSFTVMFSANDIGSGDVTFSYLALFIPAP